MTQAAESKRAALTTANAQRTAARLDRMALLAEFATAARAVKLPPNAPGWHTGPGISSKEIAAEFIKKHPQPPELGRGSGYAGALRMLIELERIGVVPRRL